MTNGPSGIEYNDEDMDTLFRAVGFIVVQWGQAEQSLDLIVAGIFHEYGGKRLARKNRMPVMLKTKLEFVSKCLSQIPTLSQFTDEGDLLVSKFEHLSQRRHDFVHGAVASLSPIDGAFVFIKFDVAPELHVAREVRLDASEFPALTKELVVLGGNAVALARKIWDHCEKHR
jgi:hypothetical protein